MNGYLYVVGGNNGSSHDDIYYNLPNPDGSLSNWITSSYLLPDNKAYSGSAVYNGYLYIVAGNAAAATDTVYYASGARIRSFGSLDLLGTAPAGSLNASSGAGSLTAGNALIVGTLSVQDQVSFNSSLTVRRELSVNGSAYFSGDGTFGGTVTQSATNQTAFRIQNAAATNTVLTVDTDSATDQLKVQIGSSTGDATGVYLVLDSYTGVSPDTPSNGAMYYDSTNNKFKCRTSGAWVDCNGRGATRTVGLSPEFAGAVIMGDGADNTGTLTADYDSTNRRNYYDWSTTATTLQDYDIYVRTMIPSEAVSVTAASFNIFVWSDTNSTANADATVVLTDSAGVSCNFSGSALPATASTWTEKTYTSSTCALTANTWATFRVTVKARTNGGTPFKVRIGELRFDYTN